MPAEGIVKLFITPGDVVSKLHVKAGSPVKKGDPLVVMRSAVSIQSQRATLVEQRKNAIRERDNAIKQAELKLSAAKLKLSQVSAQKDSVKRQAALINDAVKQVSMSEGILNRLSAISNDALTREFVGQMELDRQTVSVGEAQIKLAQQRTAHQQAEVDVRLAEEAAVAEVSAAETLLAMAKAAEPEAAFDAQLNSLAVEEGRSILLSPIDGVVLAVHAAEGGSVVQSPILELANVASVVGELEVNAAQARWVEVGQKVTINSSSLKNPLTGKVVEKSLMVGQPRLRSLDPLAAVDYRTLSVIVALDNPEQASHWLQLQVEANIELDNKQSR